MPDSLVADMLRFFGAAICVAILLEFLKEALYHYWSNRGEQEECQPNSEDSDTDSREGA